MDKQQNKGVECSQKQTHLCGNSVYDKGTIADHWGKDRLQSMFLEKFVVHMRGKNEIGFLPHTIYKN